MIPHPAPLRPQVPLSIATGLVLQICSTKNINTFIKSCCIHSNLGFTNEVLLLIFIELNTVIYKVIGFIITLLVLVDRISISNTFIHHGPDPLKLEKMYYFTCIEPLVI